MSTAPIVKLADRVDDVRFDTVEETLESVLEGLKPGGYLVEQDYRPTSCVVVMVDERGGAYHVKVRPSATKASQEVALLEVAKLTVLREMGM